MRIFYLEAGLVVNLGGECLEYVARCGSELYFEEIENGRRTTITENEFWDGLRVGKITVIPASSSTKQLILEDQSKLDSMVEIIDAPPRHQEEAIRRHQYIVRLIEAGIGIGQKNRIKEEVIRISVAIEDARECPSVSTLRRWWQSYLNADGDSAALVSGNAFKIRSLGINGDGEEFLQQVIEERYLQLTKPSVASVYRDYRGAVNRENYRRESKNVQKIEYVSEKTLYNRIKSIPKEVVNEARLGRQQAQVENRLIQGHMPADFPLDVVEIDHTPMNLYVIDDLSHLPLGRPWLTAIKDRKSGVLLGFYISFQATGLQSIFGAIKHSLHSHHAAYEIWDGINNPWPAFGRGWRYVSDRGKDFLSLHYRSAITSLGSLYEHCKRRTPWLKGSVERFFLTLEKTLFETIKGKTFSSLLERGDYDPAKQAVMRFSMLVYLMHKWAADFHNITPNSRTLASPLELWNEGIMSAPQAYPADISALNVILGKRYKGMLSHEGIRYKRLTYSGTELKDLVMEVGVGRMVEFTEVAEDVSYINVKHPRTSQYFRVSCTRPDYAVGLSHFQHDYLRAASREAIKSSGVFEVLIKARMELADIIANECSRRLNKSKAKFARILEINSERVLQGHPQSLVIQKAGGYSAVDAPLSNSVNNLTHEVMADPPVSNIRRVTWEV